MAAVFPDLGVSVMNNKKILPDDTVNICCGASIYGGTYIGLNDYRISGGKPKFGGTMYHDKSISYRDIADAFSEEQLKLILKIKQGKIK